MDRSHAEQWGSHCEPERARGHRLLCSDPIFRERPFFDQATPPRGSACPAVASGSEQSYRAREILPVVGSTTLIKSVCRPARRDQEEVKACATGSL